MQQELLACFDRDHRPLPPLPKNLALSQPYPCYHAVAKVWVINQNGEILCSMRNQRINDGGKWQTYLREYVLAGDSSSKTAQKLLNSQLGLEVEENRLMSVGEGRSDSHAHFYSHFAVLWSHSDNVTLNPDKIQEIKWFSFDRYANLVLNFPQFWYRALSKDEYQAMTIMLKINK